MTLLPFRVLVFFGWLCAHAAAQESVADLLQRGLAKHRDKDFSGAIAVFSQAIALEPNNALAFHTRGATHAAANDFQRAIADFTRAIELNPTWPQAFRSRATARMKANDLAGWTADTDRAKELELAARSQTDSSFAGRPPAAIWAPGPAKPADPAAAQLLLRSAARNATGDAKGAGADLDEAVERWPAEARVHAARGQFRFSRGDGSAALGDFERALQLDPNLTEARIYRAFIITRLGDVAGALAEYDWLIAHQPSSPAGYWGRGDLRQELGDYGGAISDYTAVLGAQPTHAKLYVNRGNARRVLGEQAEALKDYGHALRLDPADDAAWWNRGVARARAGDAAGAIADFDECLRLKPNHFLAQLDRARARIGLGRTAEALADLDRALNAAPRQPQLLYARGLVLDALRQPAAAVADFTAAIAQEKTLNGHYHQARAAARAAAGDLNGAEEDRRLVRKAAAALSLMALSRLASENGRNALGLLDDAIELDPETADHYVQRGKLHQRFDRHAQAVADFSRALELRPDLSEVSAARAESLRRLQPPVARRVGEKSNPAPAKSGSATKPGAASGQIPALQRTFLEKQMKGDFPGAHAGYSEVIRQHPGEPSAFLRRATMNLLLERTGEAVADLDRVLELDPPANLRSFALMLRGVARQVQGDWIAAVTDFAASHAAVPNLPPKTRFFRHHLLPRLGRRDPGAGLAAVTARIDQEWLRLLGGYLEGGVTEADLLARTDEGDPNAIVRRRSAAYYHIGMTQLREGRRERAREFFQRALAVDMTLGLASEERIAERVLARAELARLTVP